MMLQSKPKDSNLTFLGYILGIRNFLIDPDRYQSWELLHNSFLSQLIGPVNEAEISQLPLEEQGVQKLQKVGMLEWIYYVWTTQPPSPLFHPIPTSEDPYDAPLLRNALGRKSSTLESSTKMQGCLYARDGATGMLVWSWVPISLATWNPSVGTWKESLP